MDLTIIKLGGSLITDKTKPFTERPEVIKRLCQEIKEANLDNLIITHGGGSYPHVPAKKYENNLSLGYIEIQNAALQLNSIIVNSLARSGVNAVSFQPSASCIAENEEILEWSLKPIELQLQNKIIPVPYGDIVRDLKKTFSIISTEKIIVYLAKKLADKYKIRIIAVTDTDGVYTQNQELIPIINKDNIEEIKKHLSGSKGIDVTGGMLHKVLELFKLTELNIDTQIINGLKENNLKNALLEKEVKGTTIKA